MNQTQPRSKNSNFEIEINHHRCLPNNNNQTSKVEGLSILDQPPECLSEVSRSKNLFGISHDNYL